MAGIEHEWASAVVIEAGCVLLLSARHPGRATTWHFPGGPVRDGEHPRDVAIRELWVTTGLHATAVLEHRRAEVEGRCHHFIHLACEHLEVGAATTGPEHGLASTVRAEWVARCGLTSMDVAPVWDAVGLVTGDEPRRPGDRRG